MVVLGYARHANRAKISAGMQSMPRWPPQYRGVQWCDVRTVDSVRQRHAPPTAREQTPVPVQQVWEQDIDEGPDNESLPLETAQSTTKRHVPAPLVFEVPEEISLYTYYVNRVASELQAKDGFHNPYRKLAVLSLSFPVLFKTICSCAAEHLHALSRCPATLAVDLQDKAINAIRSQLAGWRSQAPPFPGRVSIDIGMNADEALLAAVLLQPGVIAFSGSAPISAQTHLDIAFYLLKELEYISNPEKMNSWLPKFLLQRFAIVELGICVWHRRRPRFPLDTWFFQSPADTGHDLWDDVQPSFAEMTGCPHVVFTLLHRVLHLAADAAGELRQSPDTYKEAIDLETEIRLYDRREATDDIPMNSIRQCFIHACLILLLRRVFQEGPSSARVQNSVRTIFALLDDVPTTSPDGRSETSIVESGIDSATGLPFYLAAREAVTRNDQEYVREKHQNWRKVYPNLARVQLMDVAEELWAERMKDGWSEEECARLEAACDAYLF
ncbi:fungal-specific transcription factor domain-containing protein [Aspergillus heterothallicus]